MAHFMIRNLRRLISTVGLALIFTISSSQQDYPVVTAQEPSSLDYQEKLVLIEKAYFANEIAWNPQNTLIATAESSIELLPVVKIWDSSDGRLIHTLELEPADLGDSVTSLEWSPNGEFLAISYLTADGIFQVWDISYDESIMVTEIRQGNRITGPSSTIYSLAWNGNNQLITTGGSSSSHSNDRTVDFWDITIGSYLFSLSSDAKGVVYVSGSPNGQAVATSNWENEIQLWSTETLALLKTAQNGSVRLTAPTRLEWSPDGSWLIGTSCQLSPNGECVIWVWNVSSEAALQAIETDHIGLIADLEWHPNGQVLASGGELDKTVQIWDMVTHKQLAKIDEFEAWVTSVAWSPDGTQLATATWDGPVQIWEIKNTP